ncbi:DUF362 domain-containing protein [Candidatus Margulisiibacteriota bacterium]
MRALLLIVVLCLLQSTAFSAKVYILKTTDRAAGIKALLKAYPLPDLQKKKVVIKPNYNSADPFPASTHLDTLRTVIRAVKRTTPESVAILERSGMGNSEKVLINTGIYALGSAEGVAVVNLDTLSHEAWTRRGTQETHWKTGYLVPNQLLEADYVINLPCLKTHRYGGDFTMSLKNNVGLVAKWHGRKNYMRELHSSKHQRLMIAEINKEIPCDLVILDGIKGFSTGGPAKGQLIKPGIMMLSTDRVAIDAVGVAILRHYGTTEKVAKGRIFDQEQIKRAAQLGIGAASVEEIELVALDQKAAALAKQLKASLK